MTNSPDQNPLSVTDSSKTYPTGVSTEILKFPGANDYQTESQWLWNCVLTLTDAIATIERKYHHKEITYDEYEEHSKRYESEAVTAIKAKMNQQATEREAAAEYRLAERIYNSDIEGEDWRAIVQDVLHQQKKGKQ